MTRWKIKIMLLDSKRGKGDVQYVGVALKKQRPNAKNVVLHSVVYTVTYLKRQIA